MKKAQLTAPQASAEEFFSCARSTGLNHTDSAFISARISRNVTSAQDERLPARPEREAQDEPATLTGSAAREALPAPDSSLELFWTKVNARHNRSRALKSCSLRLQR